MTSFRVIDILQSFTPGELAKLQMFISMKPFKYRREVLVVYNTLYIEQKGLDLESNEKLSKLYKKDKLATLMNRLLDIVEQYCVVESIKEYSNSWDRARHLQTFLMQKNLKSRYQLHLKKNLKSLKSENAVYAEDCLARYLFVKELAIHEKIREGRRISISLLEYMPLIDVFFCIERMKLVCEVLSRPNATNETIIDEHIPAIIAFAENYRSHNPLINIYLEIAEFLNNDATPEASKFDLLLEQVAKLPNSTYLGAEQLTIYHLLLNFSLRAVQKGDSLFRKKFLSLIAHMETTDSILENGTISPPIFKVVISVALKEKRFDLAESFYNKYRLLLPDKSDSDIRNYCKALISFHKKEYSKASMSLAQIKKSRIDYTFIINIKKLEVQLLIEKEYRPLRSFRNGNSIAKFERLLRNLELYVDRLNGNSKSKRRKDGISKLQAHRVSAFTSYLQKIVFPKSGRSYLKEVRQTLRNEIEVAEKQWLLSLVE